MEVASSAPVSKLAVECKIFVGVFYDAMLSYGCKCSEMLFEAERKEKKFNRYKTWHQLDPKIAPA